jgi:hypothetical protein
VSPRPDPSPARLAALTDGDLVAWVRARGVPEADAGDAVAWLRVEAAYRLPGGPFAAAHAEVVAALEACRRGDHAGAGLAIERARAGAATAMLAVRLRAPPVAARLDGAFAAARSVAASGVLDEVLERPLRRISTLLDEAAEVLAR